MYWLTACFYQFMTAHDNLYTCTIETIERKRMNMRTNKILKLGKLEYVVEKKEDGHYIYWHVR